MGDLGVQRVLTVPNLLSLLRLAGVPLFLWLLLGPKADGWAIVVLTASGVTDWLDGKLARWLNQMSRLGPLLDPAADRLYTLATIARPVGYAFTIWGSLLFVWSGLLYVIQTRSALRGRAL